MAYSVQHYVCISLTLLLFALTLPGPLAGQIEIHEDGSAHSHGLHFSHPLVAESVSPDTKVRLDFESTRLGEADHEEGASAVGLEAEYAFHRSFSVEVQVPYDTDVTDFGETHVGLKFANYAFEDQGVLLGYGVDFGLPTGGHVGEEAHGDEEGAEPDDGHGDDIYEFEPFFNIGWMTGRWELVGFTIFGIPTNQEHEDEARTEVSFNVSALYHFSNRVEGLLEYDARTGLSGHGSGEGFSNVSPGVKVRPLADSTLQLGLAASFPAIHRNQFDARIKVSAFYHF